MEFADQFSRKRSKVKVTISAYRFRLQVLSAI